MKNALLLTSLLFLLSGCGGGSADVVKGEGGPHNSTTDATFYAYVDEYENWYRRYNNGAIIDVSHIPINFGQTTKDTAAAQCVKYTNGHKEIIVNRSIWDSHKFRDYPDFKKILVFHELGHCHQNRDHKDDRYLRYNLSFMNTYPFVPIDYSNLYEGYMEEMSTGDTVVVKATIQRVEKFNREIIGKSGQDEEELTEAFAAWLGACAAAKKQFLSTPYNTWDLDQVEEAMRQC